MRSDARVEIPVQPFPDTVNCDLDREKDEAGVRPSDWLIGTAALIPAAIKIARDVRSKVEKVEKDAA